MDRDEGFEPKPGRMGRDGRAVSLGRDFRNRVIKAANLARGGRVVVAKPSAFTGKRLGRGNGAGTVLSSRTGSASFRSRRVMVKARIVKLAGKGMGAATAHIRYIQRDGVTRSGERGELYDSRSDAADGRAFLDRADGDRHQFRFIVSPEDGMQYEDLRSVTRRLMSQMETDLGTKLDWVAVDHFNTGHPHTHILIRGKDDLGKDLIMARSYITDGVRERASDIVAFDLGPRTEQEVSQSLQKDMTAERFTTIDKWILERRDSDGRVRATDEQAHPERQSLISGRLKHLETYGLATPDRYGHWQVSDELEPALRQLGRRSDIINSLRYDMNPEGHGQLLDNAVIHDAAFAPEAPEAPDAPDASFGFYAPDTPTSSHNPIIGRLVRRGLYDEIEDRHYLVIDGVDGKSHIVDIGKGENTPQLPDNGVVRISPAQVQLSKADRTIIKIAQDFDGEYSATTHRFYDPKASDAYIQSHVRRVEAVRRGTGRIEYQDGGFIVGDDYARTALDYERQRATQTPVKVELLSPEPIKALERRNALTWLDRELTSAEPTPLAATGFGQTVRQALAARTTWMVQEGLFTGNADGTFSHSRDLEHKLAGRELKAEGERLSRELGKPYGQIVPYERFSGVLNGKVTLTSGQYALVERARDFALVPWRDVLEKQIGRQIGGISRGGSIDWSLGRDRGPSIGM
ncbi:MAG: DUF3363 domain-containing protein [Asticcacaulis sp.]